MLGQIIPIIDIAKSNRSLREKNRIISNIETPENIEIPKNIEEIDIKYLEDAYNNALETKNKFEDKAKTIIAALTISITLILNLSKIIDAVANKIPIPYFDYVIFLLAILSILYMLMAGIMSIQVLIKENILYAIPLENRANKKSIFLLTKQNINQNLIRNNIIYAAYISIRNSVVCLLFIFILAIYPYNASENSNINRIQINNGMEIAYGSDAVEWILNSSEIKPDFNRIIEAYEGICNDGTRKNIYDKNQGIIVTIEFQNNLYFISNIMNNITEIR